MFISFSYFQLRLNPSELQTLVSCVEERKDLLYGRHSSALTVEKKNAQWKEVALAVSSLGVPRTSSEVKDKKTKWFSDVKAKVLSSAQAYTCVWTIFTTESLGDDNAILPCQYSKPLNSFQISSFMEILRTHATSCNWHRRLSANIIKNI